MTERCLLLHFACSKPKCMAVPHAHPAAGKGVGTQPWGRGVQQAPLDSAVAKDNVGTPVTAWMASQACSLGNAGVPHEGEAASAGANRRNITTWTETINCCHICQLFLLFSQQLSNSFYLL